MLKLSKHITIPAEEITFNAIRAQGSGGQNVNKVSTAIHLRFDINASSLPEFYREKLLKHNDQRISSDGIIVIKAQQYRSQEKNRAAALERLKALILAATATQKARRATRPTRSSQRRRLDSKKKKGQTKAGRGRVDY